MIKRILLASAGVMLLFSSGCASSSMVHPIRRADHLKLGMTPEEVEEELGSPYAVVAAKVFQDESTTMVWEYWPPFFSMNDAKMHVIFENDRLVQWGKPGDYGTGSASALREYKPHKQ